MTNDAWRRRSEQDLTHPECVAAGYKYNMTDLCAALGVHQLRRLDDFIEQRRHLTEVYRQELGGVPEVDLSPTMGEARHAHHLFAVTLRTEMLGVGRDAFVLALRRENIGTGIHFRGLHLQPFYREKYGLRADMLPRATFVSERVVSLPLYPSMDPDDVRTVANAVKRIIAYYRNTDLPARRSFVNSARSLQTI
jgi:dTDP-4-amino-4,6-dideoxygalactose transaminase